jgi:hypothetical protein
VCEKACAAKHVEEMKMRIHPGTRLLTVYERLVDRLLGRALSVDEIVDAWFDAGFAFGFCTLDRRSE